MKLLAVLSPLLLLFVHGLLYNPIGSIAASRGVNYSLLIEIPLDAKVPFVPVFVLPYLFVWVFPILLIGYLAHQRGFAPVPALRISVSLAVLMLTCYVLWILFPVCVDLRLEQAVLERYGFLGTLVGLNYEGASQWNACPSFHVAGPWFLYRAVRDAVPRMPRIFLCIALAIAASTVLIRIHFLLDIVFGMLVAELVYQFVLRRLPAGAAASASTDRRPTTDS